jgi:catechol-2,3-dioxygenase
MDKMGFEPLGLEHIALQVRDQEAAQKFYIGILGCEIYRINPEVPLIQMRFGAHLIDLLPGGGAHSGRLKEGIHHFCLSIRCDDMSGLAAHLAAKGAKLEGEIRSQHGAYGISQSLYLVDPDGYIVELKAR